MVVVPLLVESGVWKNRISRILVVDSPETLQIERVMLRSGLSEEQVRAIMAVQASRQERLSVADDVIVNDAAVTDLSPQMDRLHGLYCSLAEQNSH